MCERGPRWAWLPLVAILALSPGRGFAQQTEEELIQRIVSLGIRRARA